MTSANLLNDFSQLKLMRLIHKKAYDLIVFNDLRLHSNFILIALSLLHDFRLCRPLRINKSLQSLLVSLIYMNFSEINIKAYNKSAENHLTSSPFYSMSSISRQY